MNVPRKSIAYNSFFAFIDKAYTAITNLALLPFIVHFLGLEVYGIWVILTTVSSYFHIANCGINISYEKFIAQFNATGDELSLRRFIVTAFYASAAVGTAILLISLLCRQLVFHLLLKNDTLGHYSTVFFLIMLSSSCSFVTLILTAIPRGFQRYDFSGIISIGARTFYIIAVVIVGLKGFGLIGLVAAQYVFILFTVILSIFFIGRFMGRISFNPRFFDRPMLTTMIAFGIKMQVSVIASMISQSFDKLLIAHFLSVRFVALYDIGSRLVVFLKDLPPFLFASITPRTSELHSLNNREGLQRLYLIGTKYLSVICLGIIPLLYPVAGEILTLWMRRIADPLSINVFQILLWSTMLNSSTGLGTSIGLGIGKPGIIAYSNIVMVIVNILCSAGLFFAFGVNGIVWGTASGLVVSTVIYFALLNRSMNINGGHFWSSVLSVPLIVNVVAMFALAKLHDIVAALRPSLFSGINAGFSIIAVNTFLVLLLSAGIYTATKFILFEEVRGYFPFSRKAP